MARSAVFLMTTSILSLCFCILGISVAYRLLLLIQLSPIIASSFSTGQSKYLFRTTRFSSDLPCCIQSLLLLLDTFISASTTRIPQRVILVESASPVNSANATEDFGYQPFIRQHTNLEIPIEGRTQDRSISQNIHSFSGHSFFSPNNTKWTLV